MSNILKKFFAVLILGFVFFNAAFVFAQPQEKIEINFFYSKSCPHCAQANEFLNDLEKHYPEIEVKRFNIFEKESVAFCDAK